LTLLVGSFKIARDMNDHIVRIIFPAVFRAVVRVSFWWADLPAL